MPEVDRQCQRTTRRVRVFIEFLYKTASGSWSSVIAKAEPFVEKKNPRLVVILLPSRYEPAQKVVPCSGNGE
jgi:hypothetical protein